MRDGWAADQSYIAWCQSAGDRSETRANEIHWFAVDERQVWGKETGYDARKLPETFIMRAPKG